MKKLEIYLHIPFCARKCAYCDFLSFPAGEDVIETYVQRLLEEISEYKEEGKAYRVSSVFVGGGTPSLLSAGQLSRLMDGLFANFDVSPRAEITLEANPGTLTPEKLSDYRKSGINRLSIGLQSADDAELALLGRIHTYGQFLDNYRAARNVGFDNINVDLMSALPGRTAESFCGTLKKVIALAPEHISVYSLIIEPGTPFYARYHEDAVRRERGDAPHILPSEEEERRIYALTNDALAAAGYRRYEISNYAKPGRECRHNTGYWQGTPYLGFGLGASSYINGTRTKNVSDLSVYLNEPFRRAETHILSEKERMEEFMFLGFRMTKGVSEAEFARRFGRTLREVYGPVLDKLTGNRLIEQSGGRLRLTARGVDISNYVLSEFLL